MEAGIDSMTDIVVDQEDVQQPEAKGAMNRRYRRFMVEIPGYVVGIADPSYADDYWELIKPDSDPVTITDLTVFGLYFTGRAYFEEDDDVWVALGLGGEMIPIRGVVVHRTDFKDDDGGETFGVGVQFIKSDFAPAAVAAILDYLHPPAKTAAGESKATGSRSIFSAFRRLMRKEHRAV